VDAAGPGSELRGFACTPLRAFSACCKSEVTKENQLTHLLKQACSTYLSFHTSIPSSAMCLRSVLDVGLENVSGCGSSSFLRKQKPTV
jgi:hypothetical protein